MIEELRKAARQGWAPRHALHVRIFRVYSALLEVAAARLGVARLHRESARCFQLQKHWWQEVHALDQALAKCPQRASWHFRRGEVREHMNHRRAAAADYQRAIELRRQRGRRVPAHWHYRHGQVLGRIGGPCQEESGRALRAAVAADRRLDAGRLGLGVFHEQRGYWPEAAAAYAAKAEAHPEDPLLLERRGLAAEHCLAWEDAEKAYRLALERASASRTCIFRHGYVLERLGRFTTAAERYRSALAADGQNHPVVAYRLGCALAADHQLAEASNAFALAAPRSSQVAGRLARICAGLPLLRITADKLATGWQRHAQCRRPRAWRWLTLAFLRECAASPEKAAAAYLRGEALLRQRHALWIARRAESLRHAGSFEESCQAFRLLHPEPVQPGRADGPPRRRKKDFSARAAYGAYLDELPIKDKTVFFESYFGAGISCNPYAIFRHMQRHAGYADWAFLWVVEKNTTVPERVLRDPRVLLIRRESDAYRRYLASARFLVSNSTFPSYFVRRQEQAYLNTWHGTPLKTLGRDIKSTFMERANTARNFLHATHLLSPNPHTSRVLLERYDIAGSFRGRLLETGYPRIDFMLRAGAEEKAAWRAALGLTADEKVVLYAPTWRGRLGQTRTESGIIERVVGKLRELPCRVLFRGHYFVEHRLRRGNLKDCLVPADIDTNDLLSIVDVLVTDYSSIAFDYLPTGRPVCFYAYDLEQYEKERGLYFPLSEMPGTVCREAEQVATHVAALLAEPPRPGDTYAAARARFCPHDDGFASSRVVDTFFSSIASAPSSRPARTKPSLLFYPGAWIPNGITTSFLNLAFHLAGDACSASAVVDTEKVARFRDRREQLDRVSSELNLLGRVGKMVLTEEDWRVVRYFNERHDFASPAMQQRYRAIFAREYRRLFGDATFDALIEFSGYSVYWSSVFGSAPSGRRVIYQHNDMASEWRHRFPSLESVFRLYSWFHRVVAVSRSTMELNRKNLASAFGLPEKNFTFCRNLQNPAEVLAKAAEKLEPAEEERYFAAGSPVFVTIGRLSVEKDHAKLVRAFAALRTTHPSARLLVVGDGQLRPQLQKLIRDLGQTGHIHLLGQQANPFKWLARASCFVLPSNYEGQPMVLFEALILGKPIIATDITGNRSVVDARNARLVENNEDALRQGLQDFADGSVAPAPFDIDAYNREAMAEFMLLALGPLAVEQSMAA